MADVDAVTLTPGATRDLTFFGILADSRLLISLPFVMGSSAPAVAHVDARGRIGAVAEGRAVITAEGGGRFCSVNVLVVAPAAPEAMQVVVEDADTGRPVQGAPVQLRTHAGSVRQAITDQDGHARFVNVVLAEVSDITTAPATHGWLTFMSPGTRDLLMRVPAVHGATPRGSVTRPDIGGLADVQEGLHVVSLAGDLDRLSLATLAGPPVDVLMTIEGLVENAVLAYPAAMTLRLQHDGVKAVAVALADGTCGPGDPCPRAAVTFGYRIPINRFGPFANLGMLAPDAFLWDRIPLFREGLHAVDFRLLGPVGLDAGVPSAAPRTPVVVPARQGALWQVPPLPSVEGEFPPRLMQAVILVGVLVPRMGFVPLGFDAVADACVVNNSWECPVSPEQDGVVSCAAPERLPRRCDGLQPGQVRVSHAYAHDGLEAFPPLAMVLASWPGDEYEVSRPTSLLVGHARFWSDAQASAFAAPAFLGIPDGRWSPSQRTYTLTRIPREADFVRLRAEDGTRSWTVYAPVPAVPAVLEWPPAPPGAAAFAPGDATLSSWQLASGSLAEMSSIRGGGLRDL
ncbi:MAG: hypothetical protein HY904_23790, partial [Deltaproteobacteria bacterium]|nr:hypothetical protein [Deltaproteobacteria bacterium]